MNVYDVNEMSTLQTANNVLAALFEYLNNVSHFVTKFVSFSLQFNYGTNCTLKTEFLNAATQSGKEIIEKLNRFIILNVIDLNQCLSEEISYDWFENKM